MEYVHLRLAGNTSAVGARQITKPLSTFFRRINGLKNIVNGRTLSAIQKKKFNYVILRYLAYEI